MAQSLVILWVEDFGTPPTCHKRLGDKGWAITLSPSIKQMCRAITGLSVPRRTIHYRVYHLPPISKVGAFFLTRVKEVKKTLVLSMVLSIRIDSRDSYFHLPEANASKGHFWEGMDEAMLRHTLQLLLA